MAKPIFIRQAGQTATLQVAFPIQRFGGPASGGRLGIARFASGPSIPSVSTGKVIKR